MKIPGMNNLKQTIVQVCTKHPSLVAEYTATSTVIICHHHTYYPCPGLRLPLHSLFHSTRPFTFILSPLNSRFVQPVMSFSHSLCGIPLFRLPSIVPSKIALIRTEEAASNHLSEPVQFTISEFLHRRC